MTNTTTANQLHAGMTIRHQGISRQVQQATVAGNTTYLTLTGKGTILVPSTQRITYTF